MSSVTKRKSKPVDSDHIGKKKFRALKPKGRAREEEVKGRERHVHGGQERFHGQGDLESEAESALWTRVLERKALGRVGPGTWHPGTSNERRESHPSSPSLVRCFQIAPQPQLDSLYHTVSHVHNSL